jgi:DUF4097 and DUF4098 domain-containing protein YvlB
MTRLASLLTLAGVLLVAVPACNVATHRVIRTEHRTFSITGHTDLVVNTFNGNVTVTAIGLGTADVSVTPHGTGLTEADAQAALDAITVTIHQAGTTLTITATTVGESPIGSSRGADVDVQIPADTAASVTSSNGRVQVINLDGTTTIRTSNGSATVRGGTGLDVETSNGSIELSVPTGTIAAHSSNAGVTVLDARNAVADVSTSNGPISFSGRLIAGPHSFATSNAGLALRLPVDQGFSITGTTSNASVTTDFSGLTAGSTSISGTNGDGSAQVTARTSNGPLSVTKLTP